MMLNRRHHELLLLCLALALPAPGWSQARIATALDTASVLIGDQVKMRVDISMPPRAEARTINFDTLELDGKIELLDLGDLRGVADDPQLILEQEIRLTSFDTGFHVLPPLRLVYELEGRLDTLYSNDLGLRVSTLPVTEQNELRDIKPIIEEPVKLIDFLPHFSGLGLVLLVIVAMLFFRRRRRALPTGSLPPPPPLPAHELALQRLAELEASQLWRKGEAKEFQSELTYTLREYLENRFRVRALESTTGEIDRELSRRPELADWRAKLLELLRLADMVKFAKATPPEHVHPEGLAAVRAFVNATRAPEEVENEENEAATTDE